MSAIDNIMAGAIQLARAYVRDAQCLNGAGRTTINEAKQVVRELAVNAIADAEKRGAEAMRVDAGRMCVAQADEADGDIAYRDACHDCAKAVRAIPLPTGQRQVVRLTDAQIAEAFLSRCPTHLRGEHDVREMQARPDVVEMGRAIETAVLAANGLETK